MKTVFAGGVASLLFVLAGVRASAQAGTPAAATQSATLIHSNSAQLNGMATPNGAPASAWFQWGSDNTYGQLTAPVALGAGSAVVRVSAPISGLALGQAYSFRLAVSNAAGVVSGIEQRFTTGLKVAQWGGATNPPAGLSNAVSVAGSGAHFLAVKNDGTVAAWGSDTYGESDVPTSLSNVVAVSAGSRHSVALKADGTVWAWGVSSVIGETAVPDGLSNAVAIATGNGHNLALVSDGTVVAWGENEFGQANVPAGLSNVVAIGCGTYHSLALQNDGTLVPWGYNGTGQLNTPSTLTNAVAVAGGTMHSLALEVDGTVLAWGSINGDWFNNWVLAGPGNVIALAGGSDASLMLGDDGALTGWHLNVPAALSNAAAIASGWLAVAPNVAPDAADQIVSGAANRDLPITLAATDLNGDRLALRVTSLPAVGTLYQYANGARGAAFSVPGTAVSDLAGRVIFAPVPDGFGNPYDSFRFRANDGSADSSEATVTIQLIGSAGAFSAPATLVRPSNAQLNGVATPQGLGTAVWFDWGTDRTYGQSTPPISAGSGWGMARVSSVISNLNLAGNYHFRLVSSNAAAITYGAEQMFTTGRNVTDLLAAMPFGVSNIVGIARGYDHLVALRNDGTAIAWGGNGNSQTNVPSNATNLVQVAAGNGFNIALRDTGALTGWGATANGQLQYPGGNNFVAVAAGAYHGLALRNDGIVFGWGAVGSGLNLGQVTPPGDLTNVVAISAGVNHSLALKADGTVVAWGNGYYGQTSVPGDLTNAVAIAAGSYHSLALQADGTPRTWGEWNFAPIPLPSTWSNVVAIGAGNGFNLILSSEGIVQGGISVPSALSNVVAIATGNAGDALAIGNLPPSANSGAFYGPANQDLLLNLSASDANSDPLSLRVTTLPAAGILYQYNAGARGPSITAPDTVVTDPAGRLFFAPALNGFGVPYTAFNYVANDGQADSTPATLTVTITGTPYAATQAASAIGPTNALLNGMAVAGGLPALAWFEWGTNSSLGQRMASLDPGAGLGVTALNARLDGLSPGGVYHFHLVLSNAAGIAIGGEQVFTTGQPVWSWGANTSGQAVPPALSNVVSVAGGSEHSLALLNDSTVAAWGRNDTGQATVPAGLSNVVAVAAGAAHSLALLSDGTLLGWGTNNFGQTNIPSGAGVAIAIAAGANHNLALRADGTVLAWGLNTSGQTNVPAGLKNVVAVAAGFAHSLALKSDGTVMGWGAVTPTAGLTNLVAIASGGNHGLAIKTNGSVVAWGSFTGYGDNAVPSGLGNVVAIAAGTNHNLALQRDGTLVVWGRNDFGQANVPLGLSNIAVIASGSQHNLALGPTQQLTFAATQPASQVRLSSAVLNGMATPGPLVSAAWFEWGTNSTFGRTTGPTGVGSGSGVVPVNAALSGLSPGAAYHFRLVVSNAAGVVRGSEQLFACGGHVTGWGANLGGQANIPGNLQPVVAIAVGTNHALALQADGTVAVWGTNNFLQLNVPAGLTNVLAVAAGAYHNLALKSNGLVLAWGRNLEGQTNVPATLSNVIAVAGGGTHSLALRSDGTVVGWGDNSSAQRDPPTGLSNVVAIAAGGIWSAALRNDGTLVTWGSTRNLTGFSGGNWVFPANVTGLAYFSAGFDFGVAARTNGSLVAWGDSYFNETNYPGGLGSVLAVACGVGQTLSLKADGTLQAWGYFSTFPTNIPTGLGTVVAVAAGGYSSFSLSAGPVPLGLNTQPPLVLAPDTATICGATVPNFNPTVLWFDWGSNGNFTQASAPIALAATNALQRLTATLSGLAAGQGYSYRLVASNVFGLVRGAEQRFSTGGRILAWGQNTYNQSSIPQGVTNVVSLSSGTSYSLVSRNDGSVLAWGLGSSGQTNVPAGLGNVVAVSAGSAHNLALKSDGNVVAWGANSSGQTNVPRSASNVVAVACGANHSLALRADGRVLAWGQNGAGQTNVPSVLSNAVAIAAAGNDSLALRADGAVFIWGDNTYGQTNPPPSVTNAVAIAAGGTLFLALKTDGTIAAWGQITSGQTNVPANVTNVIGMSAGSSYGLAVRTNGTLGAWGFNSSGAQTPPAGLTNVIAVAAGVDHSLALGPNLAPSATGQDVNGPANYDLVLESVASDPNGDLLTLSFLSLPAQGLLYQYVNGARGAVINTMQAPLADPGGRLIFAPAANGFGSPYASFSYRAGDGQFQSVPVTVTITVAPPVAPTITSCAGATNGGFQLVFQADGATAYCVWASTNLLDWDYLGPADNLTGGSGLGSFQFSDSSAAQFTQRFYRISTGCQPPGP